MKLFLLLIKFSHLYFRNRRKRVQDIDIEGKSNGVNLDITPKVQNGDIGIPTKF